MQVTPEQLNNAADELLKSMSGGEKGEKDGELKPTDVSEDGAAAAESNDDGDTAADEGGEDVKKSLNTEDGKDVIPESLEKQEKDVKKSTKGADDDGSGEGDDEGDNGEGKDTDALEKSIRDNFMENPDISRETDNSNVMLALVEVMSKSFADLAVDIKGYVDDRFNEALGGDTMNKSMMANMKGTETLLNRMATQTRLVKSMGEQLEDMMGAISDVANQLESFSHTPNMRKSVQTNTQVRDRNFQKSLGNTGGIESLSKSEILGALTAELQAGSTQVSAQDIISVESGAPLRPELASLVMRRSGN